jgi:hypothetical protein
MPSSGMIHRVVLVGTDVSKAHIASIRVTRLHELETTLAVTGNRNTSCHPVDGGDTFLRITGS